MSDNLEEFMVHLRAIYTTVCSILRRYKYEELMKITPPVAHFSPDLQLEYFKGDTYWKFVVLYNFGWLQTKSRIKVVDSRLEIFKEFVLAEAIVKQIEQAEQTTQKLIHSFHRKLSR